MPQRITVTTTSTTSTSTAIILNTGILRTASGLLKFFEMIIGAICLGLIAYYGRKQYHGFTGDAEHTFFFLVAFGFLLTTFLLFISALMSAMETLILPKSRFEFLYHFFGFVFYISASLALLVNIINKHYRYEGEMAAAVLGIFNAVLYLLSTFFCFRSAGLSN